MSSPKVVICGAGFIGRHIAKAVVNSSHTASKVQISSRHPQRIWEAMNADPAIPNTRLLPPVPVDVTSSSTLQEAFQDASIVVSLVGIMHGSPQDFERIQLRGAENVATVAKQAGAKLIHFSAIGADPASKIPYQRTKGLAELSVLKIDPEATIISPSIVFGPEDDFFNRFAELSKVMPFLPVFGGGQSRFQPVYVDDLARLVELISRNEPTIQELVAGKIIEAGGPQVYTYRQLMEILLETMGRRRPILSLPFSVGKFQGAVLERLPVNLFTVTRAQVEQLKSDNIVNPKLPANHLSLHGILSNFTNQPLRTVEEILPTYVH
ncbi:NAD(P)-binding protein [Pholiota conissans]|uniref:NAD(P)-binding protein n=1 Tax=Pholiota conissans TaxID=109636 RepID=A0A9P5Z7M1_9AGAR|nr:NAD(P)-binding protein [Pholiota conissans]